MGIYIPGIKPPKDEPGAFQVIVMYVGADGKLRAECEGTHEVILVPPHGKLIDVDALFEEMSRMVPLGITDVNAFLDGLSAAYEAIQAAPTIIPAEEVQA